MHLLSSTSLLLWSSLAIGTLGSPLRERAQDAVDPNSPYQLPKPSEDPWYRGPDGWEKAKPGDVLRIRPHAYKGPPGFKNYMDTVQVLFRSEDSLNNPLYAATTVFIPETQRGCINGTVKANATLGWNNTLSVPPSQRCAHALVSYHIPYDTSCFDASLSYGLQNGEPYGEIAIILARGWFVSVPDYEGPNAAYGANILAGKVILDSIRALHKVLGDYGFQVNSSKVGMWGYSSGGTVTDFAAEYNPSYAPDVKIAGAAIGGLTANITETSRILSGRDVAGLVIQGLLGTTQQYPEQRKYLDSRLKPEGPYNATEFHSASNMSGWDSLQHFAYQDVYEYLQGGVSDLDNPAFKAVFNNEGVAGLHGTPSAPVFIYQAIGDEMCPSPVVDAVVDKFCANGGNIFYNRNTIGGHNDEGHNGRQRALDFLGDVLDGSHVSNYPKKGCKIETVTVETSEAVGWH